LLKLRSTIFCNALVDNAIIFQGLNFHLQ
jgi:hypothetical protein